VPGNLTEGLAIHQDRHPGAAATGRRAAKGTTLTGATVEAAAPSPRCGGKSLFSADRERHIAAPWALARALSTSITRYVLRLLLSLDRHQNLRPDGHRPPVSGASSSPMKLGMFLLSGGSSSSSLRVTLPVSSTPTVVSSGVSGASLVSDVHPRQLLLELVFYLHGYPP